MGRIAILAAAVLAFIVFFADFVFGDEGMWLPNQPPTKALKEKHGFEPSAEWLEHVQKSCVRMGASGSLVSPNGLIMTNHHVGSGQLEKLSTPDRNLFETGFCAKTEAEELKCPDMEVTILQSIEDVTERVNAAATAGASAAEAFKLRRKAMTAIEEEAKKATGLDCEIVTLYQGARYHLYRYKRYTDLRLVMAPEKQIAFYGGDNDNFEYPRFDLDMCFFRIYEDGKPLRSEHYLKWSKNGAADGELAIVLGHPGRTRRMNTLDHLRFMRDVELPWNLRYSWRREVKLRTFAGRNEENARLANEDIFGVQNSRKAQTGTLGGLHDPRVMKSKAEAEKGLRTAIMNDPAKQAQWGDAWDKLAGALSTYREFHNRHNTLRRASRSDLLGRAITIVELAEELPKASVERLREYRDSELESVYLHLYSTAPIREKLEAETLAQGLGFLVESLGGDDPLVVAALAGMSPQARAEQVVYGCGIKDVAARKALVAGGKAAVTGSKDPLIQLAATLDPELRALRKRFEDEVEGVERECYAKIAAANFAANGERMYPDATGTLRIALGPIRGYTEFGRKIPAFTTFAGLYERAKMRREQPPFDLPERWKAAKEKLDLATPFNFVCTADIIGGNSGSPVVNKAGEVIGLIFDSNLQGLVWDVQYTDEQARAVALDSRAIIEAMRKVCGAEALADEIVEGK